MSEKLKNFWKKTKKFTKKWKRELIVFTGIGILIIGGFLGAFYSFYGSASKRGAPPEISDYDPIISPILTQTESYDFSISAKDPEGRSLKYIWTIDGVDQGVLGNSYTYTAGMIEPGLHTVSVGVSDGGRFITHEWNLTILDLQLLGDFNDNTDDSDIEELYCANNTLYFSANDQDHGEELWMYDSNGVRMVKDIYPGTSSSNPTDFEYIDNFLYFTATNSLNSRVLYSSDGTSEGTQIVTDKVTPITSTADTLGILEDLVIFSASNSSTGNELFAYNHTSQELFLIEEIYPGVQSSNPYDFTLFKDELYFVALDNVYGIELFKTDGENVSLVLDVNENLGNGAPTTLTPSGDYLFFLASNTSIGRELFATNGTDANMVKDIYPGTSTSNAFWLTDVDGTLFFRARDTGSDMELWKSDGTEGGTIRVKDIFPGSSRSYINTIVEYDGMAYFGAYDGNSSIGRELWRSDGTELGTELAADINLGDSSYPDRLTVAGDELYFYAYSADSGNELHSYHPSEGAKLVKDIAEGERGSNIDGRILECNESLIFVTDDVTHGEELWISEGSNESTVLLYDINKHTQSFSPQNFVELGGRLYFQGDDGIHGRELFQTDGTFEGTELCKDIHIGYQSSSPDNIVRLGSKIYFSAYTEENGTELWSYDPQMDLAEMVIDINPGSDSSDIDSLDVIGDLLWFTTYQPLNGSEPIVSDGTQEGTHIVYDIEPGSGSSAPEEFVQIGNHVFFKAYNTTFGWKIWKANIDGTIDMEDFLIDVDPGEMDPSLDEFTVVGNFLCFSIESSATGNELGILDTTNNLVTIYDIEEGGDGSDPELLTPMGKDLYFAAYNTTYEHELWKWDSETNLVTLVKDIQVGESAEIRSLTEMNGVLYFSAANDTYGWEIYRSDGTEEGTYILKDINPGTNHSRPFEFVVIYDHLFFIAANDGSNYQLWKTNGLTEYTNVVDEVYFDVGSHDFHPIMGFNGLIILSGDDGFHGSEIHIA